MQRGQIKFLKGCSLLWVLCSPLLLNVTLVTSSSSTSSGSPGSLSITPTSPKNNNLNRNNLVDSVGTHHSSSEEMTCQCGVFLLGPPPLEFGHDAKPVLSGHPVSANCSSKEDKVSCATICRQLIQAMSSGEENSPLVQTVVLAATRTLACQRFNESHKVPLPRTVERVSQRMPFVKLDELNKKWKFVLSSKEIRKRSDDEVEGQVIEGTESAGLSDPKWLGGFYRWCDSHWQYAGVSLQEPLCCEKHMPKKCPTSKREGKSFRQPRLIIRKRPEDDISEEDEQEDLFDEIYNEDKLTASGVEGDDELDSYAKPTVAKEKPSEEEEVSLERERDELNNTGDSMETMDKITLADLNPIGQETKRKPLNATVLAEAFQFVGALMRSLGYGDVADGIVNVLPQKTASQLVERIDVGGWVGTYQEKYLTWSREFNLGYCYLEYGMYSMANEGILGTASNLINRVFKGNPVHHPTGSAMYNNNFEMNNFISPPGDQISATYHANPHLFGIPHGNRRVRRATTSIKAHRSPVYVRGSSATSARRRSDTFAPQPVGLAVSTMEGARPRRAPPHSTSGLSRRRNAAPPPQQSAQAKESSASNNGALMSIANLLVQSALGGLSDNNNAIEENSPGGSGGGGSGGGGGGGGLLQNALPMVSQMAQSPMIQGMVSNLVTSFLTPPRGPPPGGKPPLSYQEVHNRIPTGGSESSFNQNRPSDEEQSNEILSMASRPTPQQSKPPRPPQGGGGGGIGMNAIMDLLLSGLDGGSSSGGGSGSGGGGGGSNAGVGNLLSSIVQTYLKFITAPDSRKPLPKPTTSRPQKVNSRPNRPASTTESSSSSSSGDSESPNDIVDMISDVAKPFFISWFGVVPDVPGFGQLNINRVDKERIGDFMHSDPDPGSGISDVLFGSVNLPSTGNSLYDFGNRIVYAFSRANEPTQGLYCGKQYAVNKLWDTFRFGVRGLFKR